jgi:hypothetical protein
MVYHVTTEHNPQLDSGIAWNSFGGEWPTKSPLLSERDAKLPPLQDFDSPFRFSDRPTGVGVGSTGVHSK